MSNTKHTPGPWFREEALNGWRVMGGNKRMVAGAFQSDADAYLIAAAPELLEALKSAYEAILEGPQNYLLRQLIYRAINKAEGK